MRSALRLLMLAIATFVSAPSRAAVLPVADSMRVRSDSWQRDMLFLVRDEPEFPDTAVRFAVTGCELGRRLITAVEIGGVALDDFPLLEWKQDDDTVASRVASMLCEAEQ